MQWLQVKWISNGREVGLLDKLFWVSQVNMIIFAVINLSMTQLQTVSAQLFRRICQPLNWCCPHFRSIRMPAKFSLNGDCWRIWYHCFSDIESQTVLLRILYRTFNFGWCCQIFEDARKCIRVHWCMKGHFHHMFPFRWSDWWGGSAPR